MSANLFSEPVQANYTSNGLRNAFSDSFVYGSGVSRIPTAAELQSKSQQASLNETQRQFNIGQKNYQEQVESQKAAAAKVSTGLQSLVDSYNTAFAQAKSEGEQRYQQMLSIADQTTDQQAADIRTSYGNKQSSAMQNLSKLGMGNTTIGATLAQGNQREASNSLNRLADTMQQTKLGIIANKKLDSEYAPDKTAITNLMTSATSNTGAYGTGALADALSGLTV